LAPAHEVSRPLRTSPWVRFDSDSVLCRASSENGLIYQFGNSNEPRGLAGTRETTQDKILYERNGTSVGNSDSRINPKRQAAHSAFTKKENEAKTYLHHTRLHSRTFSRSEMPGRRQLPNRFGKLTIMATALLRAPDGSTLRSSHIYWIGP